MRPADLKGAWDRFWFAPASPAPICIYRIFVGLIAFADGILYQPNLLFWFGPNGALTMKTLRAIQDVPSLNAFWWFGNSDAGVLALFYAYMLACLGIAAGFFTRTSTIAAWLLLISFHQRNPFMWHSVDVLLRMVLLTLIFSPAGRLYSVDSWLRQKFSKGGAPETLCAPWAQRLLQVQLACVYFRGFWGKLSGATWLQGSAVYYALQSNWARFSLPPFLDNHAGYCLMTWSALALEFALWCLVWKRSLRYKILVIGLLFHATVDWFLQVDLIQFLTVVGYINFVYPEDLERVLAAAKARFAPWHRRKPETTALERSSSRADC